MKDLLPYIESLIFSSEHSITVDELKEVLEQTLGINIAMKSIKQTLEVLQERYQTPEFGIELIEVSGGYHFMTKAAYHHGISTLLKQASKKKLSTAAMETLSIIAYKQPVSKMDMERVRGVNCDYSVQKLLDKELIAIIGRSEGPGRPVLYGVSEKFMDYFGLKGMNELPTLKEFIQTDNEIGFYTDEVQTETIDTNTSAS